MQSISAVPQNSIVFHHGQLRTTSLKVAEAFGKQHKDVIRKLDGLDCSSNFTERNFAPSEYSDSTGRKLPMWEMTKDGFMFLVMGFTGKKAAMVKEAYINAFNEMAERLQRDHIPDATKMISTTLTPAQQRHIQNRVSELAHLPGNSYAAVYSSIKNHFAVGTYKDVPAQRYPELCRYLSTQPLEGELLAAQPEPTPMIRAQPAENGAPRDGSMNLTASVYFDDEKKRPLALSELIEDAERQGLDMTGARTELNGLEYLASVQQEALMDCRDRINRVLQTGMRVSTPARLANVAPAKRLGRH